MFPSQKDMEIPLLQELARRGGSAKPNSQDASGKNVYESLADYFDLTQEEREQLGRYHITKGQYRNIWINEVQQVRRRLVSQELVSNEKYGTWTITPKACQLLGGKNEDTITSKIKLIKPKVVNIQPSNDQKITLSIIEIMEGKLKEQKYVSAERNQKIVVERRRLDKCTCQVCGFCLKINGKFIIEVHHLIPLGNHEERLTNIEDLVCLCPTCHTIAHQKSPPYNLKEIKGLYANHG